MKARGLLFSAGLLLLVKRNGAHRTNACACTAFSTYVRVDFVDISFRDSSYWTFIDASSASCAIFRNFVSHIKIYFSVNCSAKLLKRTIIFAIYFNKKINQQADDAKEYNNPVDDNIVCFPLRIKSICQRRTCIRKHGP